MREVAIEKDMRNMIPDFETLPEYLKQMLPVIRHDFIILFISKEKLNSRGFSGV